MIKMLRTLLRSSSLFNKSTENREMEAVKALERERIEAELARRQRELAARMRALEWEAGNPRREDGESEE